MTLTPSTQQLTTEKSLDFLISLVVSFIADRLNEAIYFPIKCTVNFTADLQKLNNIVYRKEGNLSEMCFGL